ncbi:unnamed protein product [Blepharisma stoltei]|uniref:AAA+ ATPase domain-containing protein n=1 Tax=Blepharisma stoltei TaxID=1481888 RepID=A0AAU9J4B7_9CILI|nr:unnamed protein product [Blepharisma stoltei]
MWVSYSYDVGSLSSGSELFGFPIPENLVTSNKISYLDLWNLLQEYQALTNSSTIVSYYDEEIGAYKILSSSTELSTDSEIQLLIQRSQISEIGSLLERVEDLENNISQLHSVFKNDIEFKPTNQVKANSEPLDIAMLYAAPLTRKDGIKIKECDNWNLNFDMERKKLLEAFERSQIHASIRFETATLEHLREIIELKPRIIHISCHGYYQRNSPNEFVLAFEDSKCLGMRDEVNQSRLKKVLETQSQYFNIVIVSACFSQAIGHVFLDAGIDCVIAIHDQCKILDDAAISFAVTFYRSLLRGKTIKNSFIEAKKNVNFEQAAMRTTCCCAHNHKRHCTWKVKNDHMEHTPNEQCVCEKRNNDSVHKLNCEWALKFLAKYNKTRVPNDQEVKDGSWVICCCSPEVPHNEAMKFKLLMKDKEAANKVLFSERAQKEIQEPYTYETLFKPPPVRQKIIGRNKEMQELLELGKNNRVVIVNGKLGIGKSLLVKSVAHYACERRIFKHGVLYLNLQGKTNSSTINQMIAKSLNVPWEKSKEEIARIIENMHLLIIIDNVGGIIAHNKEKVKNKIASWVERTQFPKFWIVLSGESNIKLDRAAEFKLEELSKRAAAKLIKTRTEVYQKIRNDILKLLNCIGKSPTELFQVMPVLMEKSVDEFLIDYQSHHSNPTASEESRSLYLSLTYLQNRKPESVSLIKLLSLLPAGIFRENLDLVCHQQACNWRDALNLLESHEGEEWLVKIHLSDHQGNNAMGDEEEQNHDLRSSISLDEYENINLVKCDSATSEEILMVSEPVKKYIKSEISSSADDAIICMEYLTSLSRVLMQVISQQPSMACSNVMKSVSNFNALTPSPTWKLCNCEEIIAEVLTTVTNSKLSPQKLFESMERNFWDFLSETYLRQIFNNRREVEIGNLIFEMGQCVMCIYLLLGKKNQAFNSIDSVKKCLKTFTTNDSLKHKLRLSWSAMKIEFKNKFRIEKAIKQAEKASQHFEINGLLDCLAESYLLRAIISINAPLKPKEMTESRIEEIEEHLEQAINRFKDLRFSIGSAGLARSYLTYCDWKISNSHSDEDIARKLQYSYKTFKELNLKGLEERSLYLLGKVYLNMERLIAAEESWRFALEMARKYKDRRYEVEINEQLNLIFERIRRRSGNVIVVLRAFPLVSGDVNTENFAQDSVVCTHFSSFKKSLLDTLYQKRKLIYMKFDVGNRQKLIEYIKEGCKVLHLSTCMPQMESLVLESSNFSADKVPISELHELFGSVTERPGLDLVVLAMPFSEKIGEYLINHIGINFVICFDYKEFPLCKYLTQLQLMFEKAIEIFCEKFYTLLVEGKTVRDAWKVAKQISDDFVDSNVKLFEHLNDDDFNIEELYEGKGPILLGKGDTALFSDSSSDILSHESVLFPGHVLHTSKQGQFVNIQKTNSSLVGRHRAAFEIIEKLLQSRLVHIVGQKGIGKSSLAKHIGYYLYARDKYHDGVFWINMKSQGSLAQFNENLEKEGLFMSFEDNDMEQNLTNKSILLILDDCDDIIKDSNAQFHNLIETLHSKYKLSLIITSYPVELGYPCERFELQPLAPLESASMLLAYVERNIERKEIIPYNKEMNIAEDLTESALLKECMNLPSKIKELAANLTHENFKVLEFKRRQSNDSPVSLPPLLSKMTESNELRWSDEELAEEEEKKTVKEERKRPKNREHSGKKKRGTSKVLKKQKSKF